MNREQKYSDHGRNDDEILVKSFQTDDARAFDRLVIKHQDMVFNLCFRILGDYDDAEDCSQETFIKVYKNLKGFRFQSSFTTWLYRITVNTCRNRLVSAKSRMRVKMVRIDNPGGADSDPLDIHDYSYNPDLVYEKNEQKRQILDAIESLEIDLRVLIVLREIEGRSYEDISEITGVNLGTVKSRLARARHLLREMLRGVL